MRKEVVFELLLADFRLVYMQYHGIALRLTVGWRLKHPVYKDMLWMSEGATVRRRKDKPDEFFCVPARDSSGRLRQFMSEALSNMIVDELREFRGGKWLKEVGSDKKELAVQGIARDEIRWAEKVQRETSST